MRRIGFVRLDDMGMMPDDNIGPVASEKPGQLPLRRIFMALILVPPMDADHHAVDAVATNRPQIRRHAQRIYAVDRRAFRDGQPIGAVGVVQQGETDPAANKMQRMIGRTVQAVRESSGVTDSAAVQFLDGRPDAHRIAVATMVVGQRGNVHPCVGQRIGQRHGRTEPRIARVVRGAGKGGFQVDHRQIGRPEPGPHSLKSFRIVEARFPPGRRDLRQMLHDVAREEQPDRHRTLRFRLRVRGRRRNEIAARQPKQQEIARQPFHSLRLSFLGNHPLATRLRCSNNSPIDQNDDAPHTASRVDHKISCTATEAATAAAPMTRNTHQHRTPK